MDVYSLSLLCFQHCCSADDYIQALLRVEPILEESAAAAAAAADEATAAAAKVCLSMHLLFWFVLLYYIQYVYLQPIDES